MGWWTVIKDCLKLYPFSNTWRFETFMPLKKKKGKKRNESSHSTKSIIFDIIVTIVHCHCCTKVHKSIYFSRQLLPVTINYFYKIFIGMPNPYGILLNSCSANIQQIYGRKLTRMRSNFNKVEKQFYWYYISVN